MQATSCTVHLSFKMLVKCFKDYVIYNSTLENPVIRVQHISIYVLFGVLQQKPLVLYATFTDASLTEAHCVLCEKKKVLYIYIYIYIYIYGGKHWQPTPKNLPRMQCARAIPVA